MNNIYDVYEIENKLAESEDYETEEERDKVIKEYFNKLDQNDQVIEGIIKLIKVKEGKIDLIKKERQRLARREQIENNYIERAKDYILPYILKYRKRDIGTFKTSNRKSKQVFLSAEFDYEENKDYVIEKVELKPDKKKIKEALEKGEYIHGASLIEKDNLQIK